MAGNVQTVRTGEAIAAGWNGGVEAECFAYEGVEMAVGGERLGVGDGRVL